MSAQFGAMRTGLSALVIAMADRNASASLSAAAALSQASLQLVPLYVFVRTHQKEMFASYQQLKTNFTAAVTALRVSVTAALAKIDLRSALIPKLGAVVARQLQLCPTAWCRSGRGAVRSCQPRAFATRSLCPWSCRSEIYSCCKSRVAIARAASAAVTGDWVPAFSGCE